MTLIALDTWTVLAASVGAAVVLIIGFGVIVAAAICWHFVQEDKWADAQAKRVGEAWVRKGEPL